MTDNPIQGTNLTNRSGGPTKKSLKRTLVSCRFNHHQWETIEADRVKLRHQQPPSQTKKKRSEMQCHKVGAFTNCQTLCYNQCMTPVSSFAKQSYKKYCLTKRICYGETGLVLNKTHDYYIMKYFSVKSKLHFLLKRA